MTQQPPPYPPEGGENPPTDPAGPSFQLGGATSPVPGPLATQTFMPGQQPPPPPPPMQFGAPPPGAPQGQFGAPPGGPPQGQFGAPPGGPPQGQFGAPPPPGYPPPGQPPGYPPPGYPPPPGYAPPGYPPPPGYPQQYGGMVPYAQPGQISVGGPLASPGRRFLGGLLTIPLFIVTLGIGYIVWDLITWSNGQTPAMKLMGMRVVKKDTGQQATWGTMFLRGFVGNGIIQGILDSLLIGYILLFMMFWDANNQQLWDKIAGTVVLDTRGTGV